MKELLAAKFEENEGQIKRYVAFFVLALVAAVAVVAPQEVFAGAGGDQEFGEIWETLVDWTQGTLGRIIALGIILVGVVMGIARQSLMAFAVGIGGGMGLYNAPMVVEALFTATV